MGKQLRFLGLILSAGVFPASASNISGAADLMGTTFEVSGADPIQKGNELTGMIATAVFAGVSGNVTETCTFTGGTCTLANQFTVLVTPGTSQTHAADWTISNLSTLNMVSLTLNGIYAATPPSGQVLTGFNPALAGGQGGAPSYDGPGAPASRSCADTKGVGGCLEATSTPGGTTTAQASVLYSNQLQLVGQPMSRDLWGQITLTFNTNLFAPTQAFQFKIDTDGYSSATEFVPTPEPSTFGMAGLALAFLAARRRLIKKS